MLKVMTFNRTAGRVGVAGNAEAGFDDSFRPHATT
jgi:hypothetical protein